MKNGIVNNASGACQPFNEQKHTLVPERSFAVRKLIKQSPGRLVHVSQWFKPHTVTTEAGVKHTIHLPQFVNSINRPCGRTYVKPRVSNEASDHLLALEQQLIANEGVTL